MQATRESLIFTAQLSITRGLMSSQIVGKLVQAGYDKEYARRIVTEAAYDYSAAMRQAGKVWAIDYFLFS